MINPSIIRRTGRARHALATWLASLACMSNCAAEESTKFRSETSEILLIGEITKWEEVQLRRTRQSDGTVAYRWEFHQGARDRRGQGSFNATTECFLNVYSKLGAEVDTKQVEVIAEGPDRLELKFSFEGDGKVSHLHVAASRTGDTVSVTFNGKGALFDEFTKRIATIEAGGDGSRDGLEWVIPADMGVQGNE